MAEKNPVLGCGELEKSLVVRSVSMGILSPHHIKTRDLTLESAENAAVEVLVGQQAQHEL